jgi:AcrR family transcriptional regulator
VLDAVSIRRIARELGSGAMSLYHYFDSRDELLDLMADRVAAETLVPELPRDWRAALEAIALHSRDTFRHHPWMHSALRGGPRITPNLLRHVEQSSQAVAELAREGVNPALLTAFVVAVDDYAIGFTVREASMEAPGERAAGIAESLQEPYVRALIESGEFPLLNEFSSSDVDMEIEDRFELGLGWLLDGFAAKIGR